MIELPTKAVLHAFRICLGIKLAQPMAWGISKSKLADLRTTCCAPLVYTNSSKNLKEAQDKRINKKLQPYLASEHDQQRLKKSAKAFCDSIFTDEEIRNWAAENPLYDMLKSKRWCRQRFDAARAQFLCTVMPQMEHSNLVKAEGMPEGKPPRMICADKDLGQYIALPVVGCLESIIKKRLKHRRIKGRARRDAFDDVLKSYV
eukprot:5407877-Amphidinium_carterae.1